MDVVFASPLGFLALLGIPAVLALHMLKVQPEPHSISTLFLFEHVAKKSDAGRRLDRLTSSIPMWLQLLAVLLVTWLLVQPRFMVADSRQRIVVVLDASASMSAFEESMRTTVAEKVGAFDANAAKTEWILLESTSKRGRLYRGEDSAALMAAVDAFRPRAGAHEFEPALSLARQLVQGPGAVVFVTDHAYDPPAGVHVVSVGEPTDDVGFTGLTVDDEGRWSAMLVNHGQSVAERTWWVEERAEERKILSLGPKEVRVLEGPMPEGADRLTLRLAPDAFGLDDAMTIVRRTKKPLHVSSTGEASKSPLVSRLLRAIGSTDSASGRADVVVTTRQWNEPFDHSTPSIIWLDAPSKTVRRATTGAFDVGQPFTRELAWGGLSYRPDKSFTGRTSDTPLLVDASSRPIVFLRGRALVIGFDVRRSNAEQWPSFVILLARYLEFTRQALVSFERDNVETGQRLEMALASDTQAVFIERDGVKTPLPHTGTLLVYDAPDEPGAFSIVDDSDAVLAEHAARFADVREADLTEARSVDGLLNVSDATSSSSRATDPLAPFWALLFFFAMLGSFYFSRGHGS